MANPADPNDRRTPSAKVSMRDFPGYAPNADPHDIPPGSGVVMLNVTPCTPGQLTVRKGFKVVSFGVPN